AVEGKCDGIEDRGFPGPGGPVEQKEADLVEAFKAQLLFRRVWTDGLEGEFVNAHYFTSPSRTRLTWSRASRSQRCSLSEAGRLRTWSTKSSTKSMSVFALAIRSEYVVLFGVPGGCEDEVQHAREAV